MFKTYFNNIQLLFLITGIILICVSLFFNTKEKYRYAVFFLFAGTLSLHFFAGLLDPFLNAWDERFHALAAKNMMQHPFKPMLYSDPVVDMPYNRWDKFHIWLHKPPLFLWQMSLCMKLFGVNELSVRLPGIILSSLLILLIYRIGKILVNSKTGYYAAFLLGTSAYMMELITGRILLDQNDLIFTCYVSASIWAWIEYEFSRKKYWIILIGLFSGFAILTKWMTGLVVYSAWGISICTEKKMRLQFMYFKDLFYSLLIACFIFLPWNIYILIRFPEEARSSFQYFREHITFPLDGHGGPWYFHIQDAGLMYGIISPYILLIGISFLYYRINSLKIKIAVISIPVILYSFFAIVQTKLLSHVYGANMIIYLSLGLFMYEVFKVLIKIKIPFTIIRIMEFIILFSILVFCIDIDGLQRKYTLWKPENEYSRSLMHNRELFISLKGKFPPNTVIFFNKHGAHHVEAMFYSDYTSYIFLPTKEQFEDLKKKHRHMVVITKVKLPEYMIDEKNVSIVYNEVEGGW